MLTQEELDQQLQLLATHRQTLAVYLRQQAAIGKAFSPPALVNGICDARHHIRRIKAELRASGLAIPEAPGDEELEPTIRLALRQQRLARPPVLAMTLGALLLVAGVAAGVLGNWLSSMVPTVVAAPAVATASVVATTSVAVPTAAVQEATATPGAPTPAPSTRATFDYTFDDGTTNGWDGPQDNWRVVQDEGGWVYQGTAPANQYISTTPPYINDMRDWTNYAVEMRMRIVKTGVPGDDLFDAWLTMRYDDRAPSCSGYDFYLDAHEGEYVLAPTGGRDCPWVEMQRISSELELNRWYTMRAETVGTQLRLARDGQIILETNDDRAKQGSFLIAVGPGAVVQFDDIHVEKLTT
jgi:hypothetical protein